MKKDPSMNLPTAWTLAGLEAIEGKGWGTMLFLLFFFVCFKAIPNNERSLNLKRWKSCWFLHLWWTRAIVLSSPSFILRLWNVTSSLTEQCKSTLRGTRCPARNFQIAFMPTTSLAPTYLQTEETGTQSVVQEDTRPSEVMFWKDQCC